MSYDKCGSVFVVGEIQSAHDISNTDISKYFLILNNLVLIHIQFLSAFQLLLLQTTDI